MPPLLQQGRRLSTVMLSIMVSPPISEKVVTSFNGDPADKDLIAKSTCEAELIAASEALQQGENISIVISEMINRSCDIGVSSDNAAALHMVRNGSETAWRTPSYQCQSTLVASSVEKRHQIHISTYF